LDTSGEPLFKRGLRKASGEAPLRENLAASILRLSGWTTEQALLDPMCGGGTILMEAVLMARHIAPGLGRRFAFEKLHNFDSKAWRDLCEASRAAQTPKAAHAVYGSDRDRRALQAAHACHGRFHRRHRSEEHKSELQSRFDLVCRLLLEKKKTVHLR